MISDNSLGDRLNAIKHGKTLPNIGEQTKPVYKVTQQPIKPSNKNHLKSKGITIIEIFVTSFLYGYAIQTLFNVHWDILGILSIGFLLNHMVSVFPKIIFPKKYK